MQPSSTHQRLALIAIVMAGVLVIAAGAFAAAPARTAILGVDENTAVALGPEVPAEAKFAAHSVLKNTSHAKLLLPASKKVAKRTAPAAAPSGGSKKSASATKAALKGGWKRARVSWYGPGFYGNGMAGGGKLTKTSMVCAHRTLPFGTKVQFSYKGRTVTAVVKDRGPYIAGRTFDLGPGVAKALGFGGVHVVKYRIVKK